jgi:hypothetical protein
VKRTSLCRNVFSSGGDLALLLSPLLLENRKKHLMGEASRILPKHNLPAETAMFG